MNICVAGQPDRRRAGDASDFGPERRTGDKVEIGVSCSLLPIAEGVLAISCGVRPRRESITSRLVSEILIVEVALLRAACR